MHGMPVVIEDVLVGIRLDRVTFGTSDDRFQEVFVYALRRYSPVESRFPQCFLGGYPGMKGMLPVGDDPRGERRPAGQAFLGLLAHGRRGRPARGPQDRR